MKINDDDLKKLFRSYIEGKPPLSKKDCPAPEKVADLFFQLRKEEEKTKIIDHISKCAHCLEVFELCLEMSRSQDWLSGEIGAYLKDAKKKPSVFFNLPRRLIARPVWSSLLIPLSVSVFMIIAVLMIKFVSTHKSPEDRGRTPDAIYLINPSPGISPNAPIIFRWEIAKENKFVLLDIFDDTLSPIWKSPQIFGNRYELPPEAREKIKKGKTYFWMVTAFCLDGTAVESVLEEFSLGD